MAKIISPFRQNVHFRYWTEENKWFGSFQIEWVRSVRLSQVFVKDVPYIELNTIKQSSGKAIHELIDCTQLDDGAQIYQAFEQAAQKSCLFRFFKDLDASEVSALFQLYQQKKRKERDNNPLFEQQFQEYIQVFESMPFSFSVTSYQRRKY